MMHVVLSHCSCVEYQILKTVWQSEIWEDHHISHTAKGTHVIFEKVPSQIKHLNKSERNSSSKCKSFLLSMYIQILYILFVQMVEIQYYSFMEDIFLIR